ncbi:MAG TPA: FAD:protein FMN transferase [Bacteroidales bacterium]|nr:FAD:protein FMN transferase [Bacteroidales bacterium]
MFKNLTTLSFEAVKNIWLLLASGILFSCSFFDKGEYLVNEGGIQGTSYHIVYQSEDNIDYHDSIARILHEFDMSLSSYVPNSLISKVNRNEADKLDTYFTDVFKKSAEVNKVSEGLFDITVAPLVNAWGFGPERKLHMDSTVVDSLLQVIGMEKVKLENGRLVKSDPRVKIDVNAIAQGYSCDVIAEFFDRMGIKNFLIEIGGEIHAHGKNPEGEAWRVGVDKPVEGNVVAGQTFQAVVKLKNRSLATSGNYRKFIIEDGVKYSHTINPKTGYPVSSNLLSATIIARDCITADAYATVCMVAGLEKSKEIIESVGGLEAYLIYSNEKGEYMVYATKGMEKLIDKPEME